MKSVAQCLVLIGIFTLTHSASAATGFLPALLIEVEAKYEKAATLSARFSQKNHNKALEQDKVSEGKFEFKRPNRLRWETLSPDKSLLVSNGETAWFYTPPFDPTENGQVIQKKASTIPSQLANALLSGKFSATREMKVRIDGATRFTLIPRANSAGTVKAAHIEIEPRTKLISKVFLEHRGGNTSEITLKEIELGKPLENKEFDFVAPPNTDVLNK